VNQGKRKKFTIALFKTFGLFKLSKNISKSFRALTCQLIQGHIDQGVLRREDGTRAKEKFNLVRTMHLLMTLNNWVKLMKLPMSHCERKRWRLRRKRIKMERGLKAQRRTLTRNWTSGTARNLSQQSWQRPFWRMEESLPSVHGLTKPKGWGQHRRANK
jgi:hypothetical protein